MKIYIDVPFFKVFILLLRCRWIGPCRNFLNMQNIGEPEASNQSRWSRKHSRPAGHDPLTVTLSLSVSRTPWTRAPWKGFRNKTSAQKSNRLQTSWQRQVSRGRWWPPRTSAQLRRPRNARHTPLPAPSPSPAVVPEEEGEEVSEDEERQERRGGEEAK
jgi:hypothetical protein